MQKDIQGDLPTQLLNSFSTKPVIPGSLQVSMELPKVRTQAYGINSIIYRSAATWNTLTCQIPDLKFHELSKHTCKKKIPNHLLSMYFS